MDEVDHSEELEETSAVLVYDSDSTMSIFFDCTTSSILQGFDSNLFNFESESDQSDLRVCSFNGCEHQEEDVGLPRHLNQQHHYFARETSQCIYHPHLFHPLLKSLLYVCINLAGMPCHMQFQIRRPKGQCNKISDRNSYLEWNLGGEGQCGYMDRLHISYIFHTSGGATWLFFRTVSFVLLQAINDRLN